MNFEEIKSHFFRIAKEAAPSELTKFVEWLKTSVEFCDDDHVQDIEAERVLSAIVNEMKSFLPMNAVLPSESVNPPQDKEPSVPLIHVDGFLYTDDDVDKLSDEGKLPRNYCLRCGSTETSPIEFISHSMSRDMMKYLFRHVLKEHECQVLVDVGSRLGAVLYGAYFFSNAAKICGIEINSDLCMLQQQIIEKYALTDRITVIASDVTTQAELLRIADVIVLHNAFECFLPLPKQQEVWTFLYHAIRKRGSLLVTLPSLEESFYKAQVPLDVNAWVSRVDIRPHLEAFLADSGISDETDYLDLCVYQVS